MGRTAIFVKQDRLIDALKSAEKNGPLQGESYLWARTSDAYNENLPHNLPKITPSVAMLRIKEWRLEYLTKPARKRTPQSDVSDRPIKQPSYGNESSPSHSTSTTSPIVDVRPIATGEIFAPSGQPPTILANLSSDTLMEWVHASVSHIRGKGLKIGAHGLCYWARHFNREKDSMDFVHQEILNLEENIQEILVGLG